MLKDSRMAKVAPLHDLLNEKVQSFGVVHEDLSIDESMVPYFGRHSCKQFIRAKPIRFDYKLWVPASPTGLPYHVEIYEGKTDEPDDPLGTYILKNALKVCQQKNTHSVYFDNFFSSYQLVVYLNQAGFRATGTMRKNRIMKCPLTNVKDMKKKGTWVI